MYQPSKEILKKYADVLVKFALWGGEGIKPGETVCLQVPESSKPMLYPLYQSVLEAGGNVVLQYLPDSADPSESIDRLIFEQATEKQLTTIPKDYLLERVKTCDHFISMISTFNPKDLEGVDSKRIMMRQKALKFYMDAKREKENAGNLSWTLGLYGTEEMAKEANMSLEEYWQQIIDACYLNEENPIIKWKETFSMIEGYRTKLNNMKINTVHVTGENIDLIIEIGKDRQWLGGSGRNIPSFEIFTSPDWRGTNGTISFNQPLYRYGSLITGIKLTFKDGVIVEATADQNEKLLKDMIEVENANKVGEFSLTDSRFSKITKFMAETLFDENVGGKYGNTHIALGAAYRDTYTKDMTAIKPEEWQGMGFNDSAVHCDIMSTTDRTVEATLEDGSKVVIYKDGQFQI